MKYYPYIALLLFFIFPCFVYSETYIAEAFAENKTRAKEQVLVELASALFVHIESESTSVADNKSGLSARSKTKVTTNLPILGAEINCVEKASESFCHGVLDSGRASSLYAQQLKQLNQKIASSDDLLTELGQITRVEVIQELLVLVKRWETLHNVLGLLSPEMADGLQLSVDPSILKNQLLKSRNKAASLNFASRLLVEGLNHSQIYLAPATPHGSREITEFSQKLKVYMQRNMPGNTVNYANAFLFLRGEYFIGNDGITVTYSLNDRAGNVLETRVAELETTAFQSLNYRPKMLGFDQLLHSDYRITSDFQVAIQTNKGLRDLSFVEDEEVELFVKLNQPGYFYIVGYTKNKSGEKSYVLALQDAPDNHRFVQYVNIDDANRWISLGAFQVEPPYGLEGLQVLAYKEKPLHLVPTSQWDGTYWVVADNLTQGVARTRGLVKKKDYIERSKPVESVITFNTFPKSK